MEFCFTPVTARTVLLIKLGGLGRGGRLEGPLAKKVVLTFPVS